MRMDLQFLGNKSDQNKFYIGFQLVIGRTSLCFDSFRC